MYQTVLTVGKYTTLILTHERCVDDPQNKIGDDNIHNNCDFLCIIQPTEEDEEILEYKIPNVKQNIQLEGIHKNVFFTHIPRYELTAKTHLSGNIIKIYMKDFSITKKSLYLIRSIIRKHIIRLIYKNGDAVVHAASIYIKEHDYSVLIAGESGAGKSSAVWYLLNNVNSLFMSDDVSVISKQNGHIGGDGGNIYVRPDFLKRFDIPISKCSEVSPGRKFEIHIPNQSKTRLQVSPKYVCLFKKEKITSFRQVCLDEAKTILTELHNNWFFNQDEKNIFDINISRLLNNAEKIFIAGLNIESLESIKKLLI